MPPRGVRQVGDGFAPRGVVPEGRHFAGLVAAVGSGVDSQADAALEELGRQVEGAEIL